MKVNTKTIIGTSIITLSSLISPRLLAVSPGPEAMLEPNATAAVAAPLESAGFPAVCSNRTLYGTYNYEFSGSRDDGKVLTREAGTEVYDGRGNLNVIASFNSVPGGVGTFQTARLTYVVYPNCTGVLSGDRGPYANIFVAPDGSSFTFVSIVQGQQISGQERRIFFKPIKLK